MTHGTHTHTRHTAHTRTHTHAHVHASPQVLSLLREHPHISMGDTAEPADEERLEEPGADAPAVVWGNVVAFVERLDDELFKSFQARARVCVRACVCARVRACARVRTRTH